MSSIALWWARMRGHAVIHKSKPRAGNDLNEVAGLWAFLFGANMCLLSLLSAFTPVVSWWAALLLAGPFYLAGHWGTLAVIFRRGVPVTTEWGAGLVYDYQAAWHLLTPQQRKQTLAAICALDSNFRSLSEVCDRVAVSLEATSAQEWSEPLLVLELRTLLDEVSLALGDVTRAGSTLQGHLRNLLNEQSPISAQEPSGVEASHAVASLTAARHALNSANTPRVPELTLL